MIGNAYTLLRLLVVGICLVAFSGCGVHRGQKVGPTPINQAGREIPEDELLDVGIAVFDSAQIDEEKAKKEGTHPEVRKAETHFIPYHLKNTLQLSSHWGSVRVLPDRSSPADVLITGEIVLSKGSELVLKIKAVDTTGNTWLEKTYSAETHTFSYDDNTMGIKDAYQDIYNAIANDIAEYKAGLPPAELINIRRVTQLKFAEEFAPDAYSGYLDRKEDGSVTLTRLPSDDDPHMVRIQNVRDRDAMYVDTLNGYYEGFYSEMWPAYENWRSSSFREETALRKVKREALMKQISGALMLAAAIALDAGDVRNTGALQNILILGGGMVIINGINVSREAQIHSASIQELSESLGAEMKPVVLEMQGKQYELTGTVEEQYVKWQELLREIYFSETGFGPPDSDLDVGQDLGAVQVPGGEQTHDSQDPPVFEVPETPVETPERILK
jgi:hypothetical protein